MIPAFTDTRELLIYALEEHDNSRGRSQQTAIGASQLGGCRRQAFYRAVGSEEVNRVTRLPSIRGSAIHDRIDESLKSLDPTGDRFLSELTVPGLAGMGDAHIDLYDKETRTLTDWKTTTKKSLRYFPKQQQRWQIQTYGACLKKAGYDVEWVELVAIPLDGAEADIRLHREPFDTDVALQAHEWFRELQDYIDNGELPPADLSGVICEQYCPFFGPDSCGGK